MTMVPRIKKNKTEAISIFFFLPSNIVGMSSLAPTKVKIPQFNANKNPKSVFGISPAANKMMTPKKAEQAERKLKKAACYSCGCLGIFVVVFVIVGVIVIVVVV